MSTTSSSLQPTKLEQNVASRVIHNFLAQAKHYPQVQYSLSERTQAVIARPTPPKHVNNPAIANRILCLLNNFIAEKDIYFPFFSIEPFKTLTTLPIGYRHHLHNMGIFIYCGQDHEIHTPDFTRGTEPPPRKTFTESRRRACMKFILTASFLEKEPRNSFIGALWSRKDVYTSFTSPSTCYPLATNFPVDNLGVNVNDFDGRVETIKAPHRAYAITEWRTADSIDEVQQMDWQVARVANPTQPKGADWSHWTAGDLNQSLKIAGPVEVIVAVRGWGGGLDLINVVREEAEKAGLRVNGS